MRRGLYLLFEGLPATVIDSQVLLHARQMRREGLVDFEIWSGAGSAGLFQSSRERLERARELSESAVHLFRVVPPSLPFSALLNARLLHHQWTAGGVEFDLVHARTDYSATVAGYFKRWHSFELVWDCRGDGVAEARARGRQGGVAALLAPYLVLVGMWRRWRAARSADRAAFVSHPLARRVGCAAPETPYQVIPCSASEDLFFYDPDLCAQTRKNLGYTAEDRVLVYSGGLSGYQCFPETVGVYEAMRRDDPRWHLLVLTPQRREAAARLRHLPGKVWRIVSAQLAEVNAYLNAADCAVLLRRPDPLNEAASPTKFAEYGLAGLPVIMSDTVPDCHRIAKELGNLCPYAEGTTPTPPVLDRQRMSHAYRLRLGREVLTAQYALLYGEPRSRR